jgi:hypothetical protein
MTFVSKDLSQGLAGDMYIGKGENNGRKTIYWLGHRCIKKPIWGKSYWPATQCCAMQ